MKQLTKIMMVLLLAVIAIPAWAENEERQSDAEFILQKTAFDVTYGNPAAPVVLTEYASFTCPHCKDFHSEIIDKIMAPYIDAGRVYYVFRPFPLNTTAVKASILVHCLPDVEQKRLFVTALFKTQSEWAYEETEEQFMEKIQDVAKANSIDTSHFAACAADANLADQMLKARAQAGSKAYVRSTPTVFINNEKYVDDMLLEPFTAALDLALQEAGTDRKPVMDEAKEKN